jgi:hypothetical protein
MHAYLPPDQRPLLRYDMRYRGPIHRVRDFILEDAS